MRLNVEITFDDEVTETFLEDAPIHTTEGYIEYVKSGYEEAFKEALKDIYEEMRPHLQFNCRIIE